MKFTRISKGALPGLMCILVQFAHPSVGSCTNLLSGGANPSCQMVLQAYASHAESISGRFQVDIADDHTLELEDTKEGTLYGELPILGKKIEGVQVVQHGPITRILVRQGDSKFQVVDIFDTHQSRILKPVLVHADTAVLVDNRDLIVVAPDSGEELVRLPKVDQPDSQRAEPSEYFRWPALYGQREVLISKRGDVLELRERSGMLLNRFYALTMDSTLFDTARFRFSPDQRLAVIEYRESPAGYTEPNIKSKFSLDHKELKRPLVLDLQSGQIIQNIDPDSIGFQRVQ
jgi:hypothetical protein